MEDLKSGEQHKAEEEQQPSSSWKTADKSSVCAHCQGATLSPLLQRRRRRQRRPALTLKMPNEVLREDTMFTCLPCEKGFNSHSPLADHIRSKGHRGLVNLDDDWVCFHCTCCTESLSPRQLQHHIGERPHIDLSLEKVLHWYKTQPYGLPNDEQTIIERHRQGIEKLHSALQSV